MLAIASFIIHDPGDLSTAILGHPNSSTVLAHNGLEASPSAALQRSTRLISRKSLVVSDRRG